LVAFFVLDRNIRAQAQVCKLNNGENRCPGFVAMATSDGHYPLFTMNTTNFHLEHMVGEIFKRTNRIGVPTF